MTFKVHDLSDNQPLPLQPAMLECDVLFLKLYPGGTWLPGALAQAKNAAVPILAFYASDSTPNWSTAKAAAATHGIDLHDHPFAFDLREFGHSQADVTAQVKLAHADGMKVGHYWRIHEEVGQDWRWDPDYRGAPHFPDYLLWQFSDAPFDQSRPRDGVTLEQFRAATIASYKPPPPPPPIPGGPMNDADAKQLGYSDLGSWRVQEQRNKAIADVLLGLPKRDGQDPSYYDAYAKAEGKLP